MPKHEVIKIGIIRPSKADTKPRRKDSKMSPPNGGTRKKSVGNAKDCSY